MELLLPKLLQTWKLRNQSLILKACRLQSTCLRLCSSYSAKDNILEVDVDGVLSRPFEEFAEKGLTPELQKLKYEHCEAKRQGKD